MTAPAPWHYFDASSIQVYRGEPCFGCLTKGGQAAWMNAPDLSRYVMVCAKHLAELTAHCNATAEAPK